MNKLLTRTEFREAVFRRDNNKCIVCNNEGVDAHHIMERRLFADGGYYLNNGATLCGSCHIKAEQTLISPKNLYEILGVKRILPEHLYSDYEYTKWGDIQNPVGTRIRGDLFHDESVQRILASGKVLDLYLSHYKYPRTYHLPFSPGITSDERVIPSYDQFKNNYVIITLKMDGENTSGYSDGYIHARSLENESHPSRSWVRNYLSSKLYELPDGWRICGENLYAKHSIHYSLLRSYFLLFSIWNEKNECLSWAETQEWAKLLELTLVPVIRTIYFDETFEATFEKDMIRVMKKYPNDEGFVIRNARQFTYGNFRRNVAKYVRPNHVNSTHNWLRQPVIKNRLSHED